MKTSLPILVASLFCRTVGRSDTIVTPGQFATTSPPFTEISEPLFTANAQGITVQYLISASDLAAVAGQDFTGLTFRLNNYYDNDDQSLPQINYEDFTIQLSIFSGSSLSTTFADNLVNPVTVRSGALSFAAGAFPTGAQAFSSTPNGFGSFITFDRTFTYDGGDLLVTLRHSQTIGADNNPFPTFFSEDAYYTGNGTVIFGSEADAITGYASGNGNSPITEFATVSIPEPSTLALASLGGLLGNLRFFRRRKA